MSTQPTGDGAEGSVTLPDVVPFDLSALTRLSSELGSRVVGDDESSRHGDWEHVGSTWRLSVFDVTNDTAVLRVRTPVGRRRFYGALQMDFESVRPTLDESPDWERVAGRSRR